MARLGDVCKIVSGSTPSTTATDYWDGDIKWITPAELDENSFYITDSVRHITELGRTKTGLSYMPIGTVILSSRAPIGKTAIAGCEMCCNQGFKNLICSDKIHNEYLYFFLKGKTEFLNSLGRGATFKELSKNIVENIEVPLPSYEEQIKISGHMRKIEELLRLRKQQLSKLDELVKSRFIELFGDCKNEVLIGDVISISRGASPRPISAFITNSVDGVNWIKIGDVSENSLYITKTEERITPEGAKKSRMVHKGDFILSNSMSFGRPYILGINGCVHDGWLIMSDFKETFNELYLYHAIRSDDVQYQFSGKVNGATVKNLNSELVKNTFIKVPPMELQEQFAAFVEQVDKSKLAIQKSLGQLETLKKSLMQKYFG